MTFFFYAFYAGVMFLVVTVFTDELVTFAAENIGIISSTY